MPHFCVPRYVTPSVAWYFDRPNCRNLDNGWGFFEFWELGRLLVCGRMWVELAGDGETVEECDEGCNLQWINWVQLKWKVPFRDSGRQLSNALSDGNEPVASSLMNHMTLLCQEWSVLYCCSVLLFFGNEIHPRCCQKDGGMRSLMLITGLSLVFRGQMTQQVV